MGGSLDKDPALLGAALRNAEKLLADLLSDQADLERNPPQLPPADLERGSQVLRRAIDSARQTVNALKKALESDVSRE